MLVVVLCPGWAPLVSWAQQKCPTGNHCFNVTVHLNGKLLPGPDVVTLIGPNERAVPRVDGTFRVPH
jgi:hypothetical protein